MDKGELHLCVLLSFQEKLEPILVSKWPKEVKGMWHAHYLPQCSLSFYLHFKWWKALSIFYEISTAIAILKLQLSLHCSYS